MAKRQTLRSKFPDADVVYRLKLMMKDVTVDMDGPMDQLPADLILIVASVAAGGKMSRRHQEAMKTCVRALTRKK